MHAEHDEIAKNKANGEVLTWEDLHDMQFTWHVALEMLRMIPPIFGQLLASAGGHRVRRLLHPQGVAGVLGVRRDAHGPQHIPGP